MRSVGSAVDAGWFGGGRIRDYGSVGDIKVIEHGLLERIRKSAFCWIGRWFDAGFLLGDALLVFGDALAFECFRVEDRSSEQAALNLTLLDAVLEAELGESRFSRLVTLVHVLAGFCMLTTFLVRFDAKLVELGMRFC